MRSIRKQRVSPRLIAAVLIVIGVFAKNGSTSPPQFNGLDDSISNNKIANFDLIGESISSPVTGQYDDSDLQDLRKAHELSASLSNREHTKIVGTELVSGIRLMQLRSDLESIALTRRGYLEKIISAHDWDLDSKRETLNTFSASNEATINSTFGRTLGNGENRPAQLNAQMVRHQLTAPMKVIQSLLSLSIARYPETQSLKHVVDQFKYKPLVIREALVDFDFLLRQESSIFFNLKPAIGTLLRKVDETLANRCIPSVNSIESLGKSWKNLSAIIEAEKSQHLAQKHLIELFNRMQGQIKCSELGIAAYRECRYNPTKLALFSAHVDKYRDHLENLEEYELTIFGMVIPVLKEIEKLSGEEAGKKFNVLVLSVLPKINTAFEGLQLNELLKGYDFHRALEETRQFNRQTISLLRSIQVYDVRKMLLELIKRIESYPELKGELQRINDEITIHLMLEQCMMVREVLKMRVFAIDQDYMDLCDIHPPTSKPGSPPASTQIMQDIQRNSYVLQDKMKTENVRNRRGASYVMHNSTFTNERPFFVWKYRDFKNEITNLLSGKVVTLNADILAAPKRNSVKFNQILFDFRFANQDRQNAFYNVINGMAFRAGITGNNYYRCDDRIYYVPTEANVFLTYLIAINGKNEIDISDRNIAYDLLKRIKPFLSPYNTWQIEFAIESLPQSHKLKQFIGDEIDLHLIGVGSETLNYDEGKAVCYDAAVGRNYMLDRISD